MRSLAEARVQDPPVTWHPAMGPLAAALGRHVGVRRVILFGSRACGDADDRSDIDLAVDAPDVTERQWLELCQLADEAETLLPIDMVRLQTASSDLRDEIDRHGVVLYAQSA